MRVDKAVHVEWEKNQSRALRTPERRRPRKDEERWDYTEDKGEEQCFVVLKGNTKKEKEVLHVVEFESSKG